MKTIRPLRSLALALLALAAALPGAVRAQDTLSATYQFPAANFSNSYIGTLTAPLPQFDPPLGTLTAASFNYEYDFAVSTVWDYGDESYYEISGPLGITNPSQYNLAQPGYNFPVGGPGQGGYDYVLRLQFSPVSAPLADFGLLVGTGNYSIVWNATVSVQEQEAYVSASVNSLKPTSFVTVTYTYTPAPVPEPST